MAVNPGSKESFPITDEDLKKQIKQAERILSAIGGKRDLLETFQRSTPDEDEFRPMPDELTLFYVIRNGLCLHWHISELLRERIGLDKDVQEARARGVPITPDIQRKGRFSSAYGIFVMASFIVSNCEKRLNGTDRAALAHIIPSERGLTVGIGLERELQLLFGEFVESFAPTLGSAGERLIHTPLDLVSVSADYWAAVAKKATAVVREERELLPLIENATFHYNKFSVTGLTASDKQGGKMVMFSPVQPEDVIGDPDLTALMLRTCDRLALYDPVHQSNPLFELGGLIESILLDGPPGTGKTMRQRMMMTRLKQRAEQCGLGYVIKTLTADQVKSEWYGKAAQLILELLSAVCDPGGLGMLCADDVDLLLAGGRNELSGGDKDILKALMDFFAGNQTIYRGNYVSVAATNKPTGSDEALRQRFVYRAQLRGPVSWQDYTDMAFMELSHYAKTGALKVSSKGYAPRSRPAQAAQTKKSGTVQRGESWEDIGRFCEALRKQDERFTARSVKNAIQVAIATASDFDVPEEWFAKPELFRLKSWDERIELCRGLFRELTAGQIMQSLEEQFTVEQRYATQARQQRVCDVAEEMAIHEEARRSATVVRP